jgi:hypothetical protein
LADHPKRLQLLVLSTNLSSIILRGIDGYTFSIPI